MKNLGKPLLMNQWRLYSAVTVTYKFCVWYLILDFKHYVLQQIIELNTNNNQHCKPTFS